MDHKIKIFRDLSSGESCLICSCGFSSRAGSVAELPKDHVPPQSVSAPPELKEFISGLPKRPW